MTNNGDIQQSQAVQDETAIYKKVIYRIVPFIVLCYFFAYLDRVNVGFAKLQMQQELHLSDTAFGLGAGLFFIGYVLLEVPSNIVLHKVGARRWIARIMVSWGIISAALAFVDSPTSFYVLRFLLGVAEAGFIPGILLYLTYWFPAHRRGRINAIFLAAIPISNIFGGPLSGWILSVFNGELGLSAWRWLFLIEASPSILLGIITLFYLDDSIDAAKWLKPEEKALLARNIAQEEKAKESFSDMSAAFKTPQVWLLAAIFFCVASGINLISFWMPTIVSKVVKTPMEIGLLSALPSIVAVIAMIAVTTHADRTAERKWHTVVPLALTGIGLVVTGIGGADVFIAMTGLTLAAASAACSLAMFWSLPSAFLGGAAAAAGIALVNSIGNLSGFTSTLLVGWINDITHNISSSLFLFACFLFTGCILAMFIPAKMVNGRTRVLAHYVKEEGAAEQV